MTSDLYSQVHRRMVESGEWNSTFATIYAKLNEVGWVDELKHRGKEHARTMQPLHFQSLLSELESHGQASVPLSVKQEIIALIKSYLEKQFEP